MLKNNLSNLRLRFAPSPTGYLHLGGLRTCLYNYLLAKKYDGKLIFRLEDTDRSRLVEGSLQGLDEAFRWTNIKFDEGVGKENEIEKFGPYVQSLRLPLYHKLIDNLITKDKAYRCFCSKERLASVKEINHKLGKSTSSYDRRCRTLSSPEIDNNLKSEIPYVVRFKNDRLKDFDYSDLLYGKIQLNSTSDDFILLKTDGYPTYHFANVVDDNAMGINLVLRGEEWLNSTYKHLLLYEAFGFEKPNFLHLPLLLNPDGTKLSKRFNDVNVLNYRDKGYLPEALINFVGLLGFTPKANKEFLTMDQLIEEFDIDLLNKSTPKIYLEKLNHFNKLHLEQKWNIQADKEEIVKTKLEKFNKHFEEKVEIEGLLNETYLEKVLTCLKDRVQLTEDQLSASDYFFQPLPHCKSTDEALLSQLQAFNTNLQFLEFVSSKYKVIDELQGEDWPSQLLNFIMKQEDKPKSLKKNQTLANLRFLVTNTKLGPGILDIMKVLGKKRVAERMQRIEFI